MTTTFENIRLYRAFRTEDSVVYIKIDKNRAVQCLGQSAVYNIGLSTKVEPVEINDVHYNPEVVTLNRSVHNTNLDIKPGFIDRDFEEMITGVNNDDCESY